MSQLQNQLDSLVPRNLDNQSTLRGIYAAHFLLVCFTLYSHWMPMAYLFYNTFFLGSMLWAMMSTDNEFPLLKALALDVIAIPLDIACLAQFEGGSGIFPLLAGILNLLFRIVSGVLLWRLHSNRARGLGGGFDQNSYHDPNNSRMSGPPDYTYDVPPSSGPGSGVHDSKPITP